MADETAGDSDQGERPKGLSSPRVRLGLLIAVILVLLAGGYWYYNHPTTLISPPTASSSPPKLPAMSSAYW